jgi:serine protease Do
MYTQSIFGVQQGLAKGTGTGFIVDEDGYILTNSHVVDNGDSSKITVDLYDGSEYEGTVLWSDASLDLAIVKIDAGNLRAADLGDSDTVKIGDYAVAIGNPLGRDFERTVTQGIISGLDRSITATDGTNTNNMQGLIQTDASINSGNSGGPMINEYGEVIGINNAKLADTSVEGMGYAIPITTAKEILSDLMNSTTIAEKDASFLGVVGKTIDSTYSNTLGMPTGIYVTQVIEGSPAEKAGINAGDIIVEFNGNSVSTMDGLKSKLARKAAGTKVKLTIKRANQNGEYQEQEIEVTLGKKSDFADSASRSEENNSQNNQGSGNNNGENDNGNRYYTNPYDFFFGNGNW